MPGANQIAADGSRFDVDWVAKALAAWPLVPTEADIYALFAGRNAAWQGVQRQQCPFGGPLAERWLSGWQVGTDAIESRKFGDLFEMEGL